MKCFHEALSCVSRETFVGDAFFGPVGFQRRVSHRCSFGISILKDYWGIGIGSALINESIKHARICGYAQMELGVAAKNLKAQSLYKKMGFETYGRVEKAFQYDDGTTDDEIFMVKKL